MLAAMRRWSLAGLAPSISILSIGWMSCTQSAPPPGSLAAPASPPALIAQRGQWDSEALRGISGLCRAEDGRFFAVPERVRRLFPFTLSDKAHRPLPAIEIQGATEGLDLEAIACLPGDRLAFGTEAMTSGRAQDPILLAKLGKQGAQVQSDQKIIFDYKPFGLTASRNRGVEGLCFAQGLLIAASEQPGELEDQRFAPLGVYDLQSKSWRHYRLMLSSETGKISGLTCRKGKRGVEVFAVERHYEVVHLLRFDISLLPVGSGVGTLRPELVQDLGPAYTDTPPNFEGLQVLKDRFVLIADNDYGGKSGPTELLILKPRETLPGGYSGRAGP